MRAESAVPPTDRPPTDRPPTDRPPTDRPPTDRPHPGLAGQRVIIQLGWFHLGGAERQALHLARYLRQEVGARPEMWAFGPGEVTRLCDECGIPWRVLPQPWWVPSRAQKLLGLARYALALRRARPQILLSYTLLPNVLGGLFWRWAGVRLFVWGQRAGQFEFVGNRIERMAVRRTRWFISNSGHAVDYLVQRYGIPRQSVLVVRNGVQLAPPQQTAAQWRAQLRLEDGQLAAVMVGHLINYKDHLTLVRAWERVLRDAAAAGLRQRPVLVLAGRHDDTHAAVVREVEALGIGGQVRLPGHVADISGLLQSVQLGVFAAKSEPEGCPNGVLECMAAGLAVAATRSSGVREALGPQNEEFVSETGDPASLAQNILRLLQDEELRVRVGAANRERVEQTFGVQRMCRETCEFLEDKYRA